MSRPVLGGDRGCLCVNAVDGRSDIAESVGRYHPRAAARDRRGAGGALHTLTPSRGHANELGARPAPPLSTLTTLRLGGAPDRYVKLTADRDIVAAAELADSAGEPVLVLGGGSNVVVGDDGPAASVLHICTRGIDRSAQDPRRVVLRVAAGERWDDLVALAVQSGWSGVEALSGIPGTVGATPIQNVGAYGQAIEQTILSVEVYDRIQGCTRTLRTGECRFGYRSSLFKLVPGRYLILSVTLGFVRSFLSKPVTNPELCRALGVQRGAYAPLGAVREAVITLRRGKGMVLDARDHDTWSVGSFFKNPLLPPGQFAQLRRLAAERLGTTELPYEETDTGLFKPAAAWLIEQAGFPKGYPLQHDPDATASVSTKHTLALTNRGAATTSQLLHLAGEIAARVRQVFHVQLEPEPSFAGVDWHHSDSE